MDLKEAISVDAEEVERFSRIADEWWDVRGKFRPLHQINPVRVGYINELASKKFGGLSGLSILDIGCGGGLVCEPLARLGGKVCGVDASEKNIAVAKIHAQTSNLDINYQVAAAEMLAAEGQQFDVVLALEIIEHVADVESFLKACTGLVRPGGLLVLSTMNRTAKSFALAIVGAEYILRWLPRGTHNWRKFLRPSEIDELVRKQGMNFEDLRGMVWNPFKDVWSLSKDVDVNYLIAYVRT